MVFSVILIVSKIRIVVYHKHPPNLLQLFNFIGIMNFQYLKQLY